MLTITKPSGLEHMRAMPKTFVSEKKGRIPCPFLSIPLHQGDFWGMTGLVATFGQ